MTSARRAELAACYHNGLVNDVLPFWVKHGWDREHGGIITGLGRDGEIIDDDKSIWFQGRAGWMFATAYRTVEAIDDATCLEAVSSILAFRAADDPIAAMLADKLAQVRQRLALVSPKDWADALKVVGQSIRTHSACTPGDVSYLAFIDHYLS